MRLLILFDLIGEDAGFIHTARSRNDQVITDFKIWLKKDVNNMIGMPKSFGGSEDDIIKGMILVKYSDYKVNINIPDRVFKKRPSN